MLITTAAPLNNALRRLTYAEEDLRASLTTATGGDGIVIMGLIKQADELRQQLELLLAVGQYLKGDDHA